MITNFLVLPTMSWRDGPHFIHFIIKSHYILLVILKKEKKKLPQFQFLKILLVIVKKKHRNYLSFYFFLIIDNLEKIQELPQFLFLKSYW